ncbi:hypothetical protein HPB50_019174 [Hyalomma asiaticum]|uniref:Uncharacterized protein n=1 Tax=Hyalomma asiaticum TaxID=266040 RepID=A0ACB7SV88_HYAAI|nr:hypothetical protein HPB50_019174 [Hyalomma asiaticum]
MAAATTVTGYDPTSLQVVTMETTSSNQAMPSENEYLADMVKLWERKQSQPRAGTRQKAAASGSSSRPSAEVARTAGTSSPKHQLKWRPRHTPRLSREDYIVVLKPRAPFELKSVLQCDRAGDAIRTYLGGPSSGTLHVWPVWDQNVLVCSVTSSSMAQRLLGDIQLPFRGHAKASGEIRQGVITINPDETPQRIKSELEWSQGTILAVRRLGNSTAAVVTFEGTKVPRFIFYHSVVAYVRHYKKTPACTLCGTIGHRPSACPRPTPGRCTRCGTQVQVTPQGLAQHECNPTCLLCSGTHETGARGCLGKYRKPAPPSTRKPSAPPSAGLQAASQAKPGSPLNTPATPPPATAVHYPPLVTASPQRQIAALTKQVAALQLQQQKPEGPPSVAPLVEPAVPKLNSPATPNPCTTYPAPPTTAPAAPAAQGSPPNLSPIDQTLPLEDRISRLESAVLSHMSAINVEYIVAEVVQAVQAWALTQFRTKSTRSRSASTGSSSAPRRRKVAGSSSPALNPASIPLPAPQGQGQGMEDDP